MPNAADGPSISSHAPCTSCLGSGTEQKPPVTCKACGGSAKQPEDPENPYVCERLAEGQLLFTTYNPAIVFQDEGSREVLNSDFAKLESLEADLEVFDTREYDPQGLGGLARLTDRPLLSVDIETRGGLDPNFSDIICVAATGEVNYGCALDPDHPLIDELLATPTIVGQNFVQYDWWGLHTKGFQIGAKRVYDTRFMGKLLNPDTPNDLTYLASVYAKPAIRGFWKTREAYSREGSKRLVGCIDVDVTLRAFYGMKEELEARGQWHIVENHLEPLGHVTFDMRKEGMRINPAKMAATRAALLEDLHEARKGLPEGINSENQSEKVQDYIYDQLGIPSVRRRGRRTFDAQARDQIRNRIENEYEGYKRVGDEARERALQFTHVVDRCRELSKLAGAFTKYRLDADERIHPALSLGGTTKGKHAWGRGTATFRFSCLDPNAQQVPPRARDLFVPDHPGWEIMSVDLRQAEVVAFLWYAEEWDVLRRVLGGFDAHQAIADRILGREATKAERDSFKTTTFALLFGEAPQTTSIRLGRPRREIEDARQFYFKTLPGVQDYRRRMVDMSMALGFVESPFGVRRLIKVRHPQGRAVNQVCNMPIQNVPPMVIGRAMIGLHRELPKPARLWMQVHDELLFTYPQELREQVKEAALEWIRRPVPEMPAAPLNMAGGLRFVTKVKVGPNWGEMHAI